MAFRYFLLNKFKNLSWLLVLLIVILASVGFIMLYSAAEGSFYPWAIKQIIRFFAFFPVMLAIAFIPINFWLKSAYFLYFILLISLLLVEFYGITAMGASRWIEIFGLTIQPSEVMKISLVLALARYFHSVTADDVGNIFYLITPLIMVIVPFTLVLRQPDLGTAFILLMIGGVIFFAAGVRWWKFLVVLIGSVISIPFLWRYLHDYQKDRVISFLKPDSDPLGNGYNILQSKIAIGSGDFFGKGFLEGTQSHLSFLPEKQTDFIFTMLAEEFGFMGGISIIFLYSAIIFYGLLISVSCKSHFARLIALGVTGIVFLHVFINIAMVMGLIPVVGAPLPLLSYGGTIMIAILFSFGLLLNAHLYRDELLERNVKRSF